jgi:peroxiredoxin
MTQSQGGRGEIYVLGYDDGYGVEENRLEESASKNCFQALIIVPTLGTTVCRTSSTPEWENISRAFSRRTFLEK